MTDFKLQNGKPKVTMIEKFDRTAALICPDRSIKDFPNLTLCMEYVQEKGWEVNVEHVRKRVVGS